MKSVWGEKSIVKERERSVGIVCCFLELFAGHIV